jgi:two-component system sensor histidine kinase QseC
MISIRRRLLANLSILFLFAWLLLGVLSWISAQHEIEEVFDAELAESARVLLNLSAHELRNGAPESAPAAVLSPRGGHHYEERLAFQIWYRGRLVMRSGNAPASAMSVTPGYSDQTIAGARWRVFVLHDGDSRAQVQVGELEDVRDEAIEEILLGTLWPVVLTLPLAALLIWVGVGRGLMPLHRLAGEIENRTPQSLSPVEVLDTPAELRPLTNSLNHLLGRLNEALESERRFTANAAHELRTPLAGLKAQAQFALRATEEGERQQALRQIVVGVDRATHLVSQLLTLARVDPDSVAAGHIDVDLAAVAASAAAELAPWALERQIDVVVDDDNRGRVRGDASALAIMIRNLVDNAIRYTPPGGQVTVAVRTAGDGVTLAVMDTGPGIPAVERAHAFERFWRGAGHSAPGCGLGLSIVQRIAALHGADIRLGAPAAGPGLLVEVRFPA